MRLTKDLAKAVIRRLADDIEFPINIMDDSGMIVASSDPKRVGSIHFGAKRALEKQKEIIVTEENNDEYANSKPGANVPIVLHDEIIGVVGITGNPSRTTLIANVVKATVEILIEQNLNERQYFYQEQRLQNWLSHLLHPSTVDIEEVREESKQVINFDEDQSYQILLFVCEHENLVIDEVKHFMTKYFPSHLFATIAQKHEIIVALPMQIKEEQLDPFINSLAIQQVIIGDFRSGLKGIRQSYFTAKKTSEIKQQSAINTKGKVIFSENHRLEILISYLDYESIDLLYPYEDRQLTDLSPIYLNTFLAYVENNLQINRTSKMLHIHRNTLNYRLEMVKKKTGLDPRNTKDLMTLWMLIHQN
ncbi:hypothetical protein CEY16_10090 [Halalkalibacillus sediminis]|uniref:Transcriptional regulator n=1 Tax=Halalkalibacillus sediminis TaxID=2018042 RepID=A0A2I0QRY4_9BACI|nr:sugar diacid recognition domain-containing protein [Halalkalibacillus sediminis]PKR77088.1 hypothetical protein CEY16_10090 [Halalkalibacillus sediminis]